ncbi:putative ribonuclease H-like domain-containing protein, partial [Tanacetum coccineum]
MSVKRSYANLKDYDLRDVEIDDSTNTYGPQKTQPSESESQTTEFDTCDSNISTESSELVSEPIVNESNVEVQPKVWSDAPIIGGGERKPTWNNVQRVNKQNQFVPLAVQTRTGNNPVNTAKASSTNNFSTARQNVNKQTVLTSTALKVNTVKPIVNGVRPANVFHKTHSPSSRPFKRTTVLRTNFSNQKVYTAKVKEVSTVGGKWDTAVKSSAGCKWRTPGYNNNILSKYNGGSSLRIYSTFKDPLGRLKPKQAWGCSRQMTGNKAYMLTFMLYWAGPVAFGGSKGYITGKGKIKTGKLDFEDVSFVKELQHFNLFSVSQMCDKKNKVLFTDTEYHLGKFAGKFDEGFLVRKGPTWLFDLDYLTDSMNYHSVRSENQANPFMQELLSLAVLTFDCTVSTTAKAGGRWTLKYPHLRIFMEVNTDGIFTHPSYDDEGAEADFTNLKIVVNVSPIPTSRINPSHPSALILGDPTSAVQTRSKIFLMGKKGIGTKVGVRNKKDGKRSGLSGTKLDWLLKGHRLRGRNLTMMKVFAPVARLEAIRIFLAFASYMGFIVYQMDVKSALFSMADSIEENFWTLQVLRLPVPPIKLRIEAFSQDDGSSDVDVHLYRSMIGSLMYVTASRPDIMFAVCACSRFQVTPKTSYLVLSKNFLVIMLGAKSLTERNPQQEVVNFLAGGVLFTCNAKKRPIRGHFYLQSRIILPAAAAVGKFSMDSNQISLEILYGLPLPERSWALFKSKKIAQVVRAWIQSKNSLVKHFEDMRLSRPSKEYCGVWYRPSKSRVYVLFDNKGDDTIGAVFCAGKLVSMVDVMRRVRNISNCFMVVSSSMFWLFWIILIEVMLVNALVDVGVTEKSYDGAGSIPDTYSVHSLFGNKVYSITNTMPKLVLVSDQAKEIKLLKAKITKLKKQAKPVIKHFKAYLKTVSLQQRLPRKSSSKKHRMHKESVSKQGRKIAKGESSVQRDPLFDVMPEDNIDHMETDNAQSEGRTREMVDEDKEIDEVRLSTEDAVSTDKEGVSTDFEKVSTDKPKVSTDGSKVSTDEQVEGTEEHNEGSEEIFESTEEQREGTEDKVESTAGQVEGTEDQTKEEIASQTSTQTPTSMIFGDDETIATLLLNMSQAKAASKEKEKGVELKDVEEIDRPRPTSTRSLLTLKPLPKIDPKDKGKKKIEEDDESEIKKFKQLESDEELARKVQEEWEAEEERNRIAEEKATNEALIKNFDDIKARIEADRILAEKLQEQEREQFTIEERAKFLHDTIAAQRKFLA